jgi:hypothetical protein
MANNDNTKEITLDPFARTVQSLFDRVEAYGFECEAGPLRNWAEWIELRRRLNLAPPTAVSL